MQECNDGLSDQDPRVWKPSHVDMTPVRTSVCLANAWEDIIPYLSHLPIHSFPNV